VNGIIRAIDVEKRFGFITGADGQADYFFHESSLQQTTVGFKDLHRGDAVQFTPIQGPKGPRAIEVRLR
jgi:CspA family cold shock protein